ncbi:MAG: aminotransferase class III-fold pyridoxal phosphate-dependent enzyme [Rhodospirillales bacterium]
MAVTAYQNYDLAAALLEAEGRFAEANPKSAAAYAEACKSLPGGNTRTVLFYPPFPLVLSKGEGCHLTDIDGHEYVDFQVEQTAGIYGHTEPEILDAIQAAMKDGITLGGPTEREAKLANLFQERFPAVELVRFTNSGTEANLLALSTARAGTDRSQLIGFEGSYHGSVISFGAYGNKMNVPFPWNFCTYNDVEGTRAKIQDLGADLAAVIVEPMTGSGGCIQARPEFITMLREETKRVGAFLIFDEVMTSRLSPQGLHGKWNLKPDLVTFGKYLGGGLTFGAFGGSAEAMERFDPRRKDAFAHAGTFNNNVLSLSAAIAGLTKVYTPERAEKLNADGDKLRGRLNEVLKKTGVAGQVTGIGSMMMVHLTPDPLNGPKDADKVDSALRGLIHLALVERGYYVARRNMIVLSLPMAEKEFDGLVEAFADSVNHYRSVLPRI